MNTANSADNPIPIICPITGEVLDPADVDALVGAFERAKAEQGKLYAFTDLLRARFDAMLAKDPGGDTVTYRLRGSRRRVKVTMPDVSFDQRALREIVQAFPALAPEVITVASYKVAMREFKKIASETGTELFMAFKKHLEAACRGRVGLPTVSIEE